MFLSYVGIWASGVADTDPYAIVTSLGPVGFFLILLITGKLRTENELKRVEESLAKSQADSARKDEQIAALQASIMEQAIPSLVRSTMVMEKLAPLLQEGQK